MSLLKRILVFIALGIISLIAFVFFFLEFRSLLAGDYALFNSPFVGAMAYLFRGLYFLMIITLAIFIILFILNGKKMCIVLLAFGGANVLGALLSLVFYHYYVSLVILLICLIELTIVLVGFLKKDKNSCLLAK